MGHREARLWARVGVLSALALVFGYIETFIPLPVPAPGIKLGLANIVVLVALVLMDVRSAALVALVKVLASGFLFGNPVMMLYSAGGTLLAFAAMAALTRVRELSVVLVAIVGAILHNVGQLSVASVMLGTPYVWASAPVLIVAACATGALSGVATRYLLSCLGRPALGKAVSEHLPRTFGLSACARMSESCDAAGGKGPAGHAALSRAGDGSVVQSSANNAVSDAGVRASASAGMALERLDARVKLACLAAYVVVALHARTPLALGLCLAAALLVGLAARLSWRDVRAVACPLVPVVVVTVVMQVLSVQEGEVLVWLGGFAVTSGVLWASVRMVGALLGVMAMSVSFMRCTSTEALLSTLRWLLAPLRRMGARTDALMLSLSVAFRFIPVLVGEFSQLKRAQQSRLASFEGGVRARLVAYTRLFPPLVRSSFRQADSLAEAFLARAFGIGVEPSALHGLHARPADGAALLACALFAALVVLA